MGSPSRIVGATPELSRSPSFIIKMRSRTIGVLLGIACLVVGLVLATGWGEDPAPQGTPDSASSRMQTARPAKGDVEAGPPRLSRRSDAAKTVFISLVVVDEKTRQPIADADVRVDSLLNTEEREAFATNAKGLVQLFAPVGEVLVAAVAKAGYHAATRVLPVSGPTDASIALRSHPKQEPYHRVMIVGEGGRSLQTVDLWRCEQLDRAVHGRVGWERVSSEHYAQFETCFEVRRPGYYFAFARGSGDSYGLVTFHVALGAQSESYVNLEVPVHVDNQSAAPAQFAYLVYCGNTWLSGPVQEMRVGQREPFPAGKLFAASHAVTCQVSGAAPESGCFVAAGPGDTVLLVDEAEGVGGEIRLDMTDVAGPQRFVLALEGDIGGDRDSGSSAMPQLIAASSLFEVPRLVHSRRHAMTTISWRAMPRQGLGLYLANATGYVRLASVGHLRGQANKLRSGVLGVAHLQNGLPGNFVIVERDLQQGETVEGGSNSASLDVGIAQLDENGEAIVALLMGPRYRICLVGRDLGAARDVAIDFAFASDRVGVVDLGRARPVPDKRLLRWLGPAIASAQQAGVPGSAMVPPDRIQLVEPAAAMHNALTITLAAGGSMVFSVGQLWRSEVGAIPVTASAYLPQSLRPKALSLPSGFAGTITIRPDRVDAGEPRNRTIGLTVNGTGWLEVSPVSDAELHALDSTTMYLRSGNMKAEVMATFSEQNRGYSVATDPGVLTDLQIAVPLDPLRGPAVALRATGVVREWRPVLNGAARAWVPADLRTLRVDVRFANGDERVLAGEVVEADDGWVCRLQ